MKIEAVTFKCQGNELFGELYIPDETPAPGIIVCHGMNKYGFHAIELYRKFAEDLLKMDLSLYFSILEEKRRKIWLWNRRTERS